MGKRLTQNSFTAGELTPSMHARTDVSKYGIGLETLKNGFVKAEGGVSNRPGLEFVCEVKDSSKKTKVIPFAFNTAQTYIIETGHNYFRFIKDGGQIVYPAGHADEGDIVEKTTTYTESELPLLKYAQNADVLSICHNGHAPAELSRTDHHDWSLSDISIQPSIDKPTSLNGSWSGDAGGTTAYKYVVTSVKEETYEESNPSDELSVTGQQEADWGTSEYITVNFTGVTGATEYNIYKSVSGIFGYIGTTKTTSFKDDKIEPDLEKTAPIFKNPFNGAGNYPSTVNYFQQRKVFANTINKPQSLFSTQTGMMTNFNISKPLLATDAITINISEREVNEIRHLVAMKDGLIALTSGAEWKINGANGIFEATPPPQALPQSFYGCSNVMPLVSGNLILFCQAGGSVVRDLGYTFSSDSFDGDELSIFANHLFENNQIVDWAYSKEPYRTVWAVMADGTLNALTYNPKQEVLGWHRHITDGEFESVAVIREGFEDVPYFVIKRTINGQVKRYIERMKSRLVSDAKDGFFVDCGLKYEGTAVTTLSGLDHLEGKEVIILADGGVITGKIVSSGSVTLDEPASKIVVGLPYEFEFKTLPFEGDNTQGLKKSINNISVKVHKSRTDFFVLGNDGMEQQLDRTLENINNSGYLFSGDIDAIVSSDYSTKAQVHIKQKYPLPLTILSVTAEVNIERA